MPPAIKPTIRSRTKAILTKVLMGAFSGSEEAGCNFVGRRSSTFALDFREFGPPGSPRTVVLLPRRSGFDAVERDPCGLGSIHPRIAPRITARIYEVPMSHLFSVTATMLAA